jgi:asparagine synthetase B (glutamine-hydrolysing)
VGGIFGKLSFEHHETLARPVLEHMLVALRHRGSIGSGIYVTPGIALGWCGDTIASVIRPAVATNDERTIHVVADATLTNIPALRRDLEQAGHRCGGRTDADVIASAYVAWGDSCVDRLRGSFACAIWDSRRERLLLARDAAGTRPLFFALLPGHGVVFASEIRALLQDPGVSRDWCPQAIDAYLALGYVPAPLTVYQRISKLEPAQRLIIEGRRLHVERYWTSLAGEPPARDTVVDALASHLRGAIDDAVGTDGPGGLLYSGGIGSTALLTLMRPRDAAVVTVAMEEDTPQVMRGHAAAVALGFQPSVEVSAPDISLVARQLATYLDEPVADPTAIAQYSTFVAARQHIDSAVAGHGAGTLWSRAVAYPRLWSGEHRHALYTRAFAWQVRHADPFARYIEARTALADSALVIAERASTAAGLQLRFPFLERELLELAASWRAQAAGAEAPLLDLVARRVPDSLLPPLAPRRDHPWLAAALANMVPGVLLGHRFDRRGIVSRPALQRLWDEHATGRHDHSHRLWSLLMLEFWFREFVDGDAVEEPFEYAILRAA